MTPRQSPARVHPRIRVIRAIRGLPRHTKNTQTRSMMSQEDCEALRFQFLRGSRF